MSTTKFTRDYLRYLTRRKDVQEFKLGKTSAEILTSLSAAEESLNSSEYQVLLSPPFRPNAAVKELVYKPKRFEDKLYIRHLNRRLCRAYSICQPDRQTIVRQVKELLKADTFLSIVRTDIRRFFRNVDFKGLVERLRMDGFLAVTELRNLNLIAEATAKCQMRGLPWGISICSTLAELCLAEFDSYVRTIPGAYYYQRFVDDIIVFTTSDVQFVTDCLKQRMAREGLNLHDGKTRPITESLNAPAHLNYLGYQFERIFPANGKFKKEVQVRVTISESKIDRMKRRIDDTFTRFYSERSWADLTDRLKVLTGNYVVARSAHEVPIKTGIYFNYAEISETQQLHALDKFLRGKLTALRAYLRRRGRSDEIARFRIVSKFSFAVGFEKRVMHRVSRSRMEQLAAAWTV
jgi:hypothetical protein